MPHPLLPCKQEMRNLARLHAAGILCPKPLQLRLHVLGEPGRAGGPSSHSLSACSWLPCRAPGLSCLGLLCTWLNAGRL